MCRTGTGSTLESPSGQPGFDRISGGLWVERTRLLAAVEAAERTLCHLDVWPANLIDGQGRSVLLDWSFAGEGAVGEDIGSLILHSFTDGLMDAMVLPEVVDVTTDGYLQGLRDGGWSGSEDRVRTVVTLIADWSRAVPL